MKGFTLIELLIVITIIGVIVAVVIIPNAIELLSKAENLGAELGGGQ